MTPELVKILLNGLYGIPLLVSALLCNAVLLVKTEKEKFLVVFLAVVGFLMPLPVGEALKDPQSNSSTFFLIFGYVYALGSLIILSKIWGDAAPKEDDRTKLLAFTREEVGKRLQSMGVRQQQIPIRAKSMKEVEALPVAQSSLKPNLWQKAQDLPRVIVSKVKFFIRGEEQVILPETNIIDIFNQQAAKELLILGAPGAGKTTALLTLALQLCEEAEKDIGKPIPIVLELSAWQAPEKIPDWIAMQLKAKYQLSAATCQKYLKGGEFVLLLDGLDELKDEDELKDRQAPCVGAINEFRGIRDYNAQPLVVCSRLQEYNKTSEKQELQIAREYCLLALSDAEIKAYLKEHQVLRIWKSIKTDSKGFLELARQPLLLDLMRKTYKHHSLPRLSQSNHTEAEYRQICQNQLLEDYVEHQLTETQDNKVYTAKQSKHYLKWLAQRLKEKKTTEFLLEKMQPSWLEAHRQKWYRLAIGLIFGLIFGLIGGLIFGLIGGLIFGLIGGLIFGQSDIEPYEVLNLNLSTIDREQFIVGLIGGLIFGLIFGLLIGGLIGGLIVGLIVGLILGLIGGLQGSLRLRENPNEGIWKSGRNVIILTFLSYPFAIALFTFPRLAANRPIDLPSVLLTSIGISLSISIFSGGGVPFIQHFVLRYFLIRAGHIPKDYVGFLKYAEERGLILRNGGSFRFYHDLLREHLAGNTPPPPKKSTITWLQLGGYLLALMILIILPG